MKRGRVEPDQNFWSTLIWKADVYTYNLFLFLFIIIIYIFYPFSEVCIKNMNAKICTHGTNQC